MFLLSLQRATRQVLPRRFEQELRVGGGGRVEAGNVLVQGPAVHEVFAADVAPEAGHRAVLHLSVVVQSRDAGVRLVAQLALVRPAHRPVRVHVALQRLLVEEAPAAHVARRLGRGSRQPFGPATGRRPVGHGHGGLAEECDQRLEAGVT